jgi:hypothetical protein
MQRTKLIEGLSDSEGQQEQLGQERQMGQEITGNLHTKENIENFSEKPVPTSPNVPSKWVPDSPLPGYLCPQRLQESFPYYPVRPLSRSVAFLVSYCPLWSTVRPHA